MSTPTNYTPIELDLYPIDYPLETLVQRIESRIDGQKIILDPDFQRVYRWDEKGHNKRGSKFIESCLMRIPITSCYFAEDEKKNHKVIDGVQRLTTLQNFFNNKFALEGLDFYKELEGKKFSELPSDMQIDLRNYTIRCIILRKKNDERMIREIFARLNQGAMVLHDQEIRHALYGGNLDNLLKELAVKHKDVLEKFSGGKKEGDDLRSATFREENVLRFFAFNSDLSEYKDNQKEYLDNYMEKNKDLSMEVIKSFKDKYNTAMENCKSIFEDRIFVNPSNATSKSSIIYYDLLMFSLENKSGDFLIRNKNTIKNLFSEICTEDKFKKLVTSGTQQKRNILERRRMWADKLNILS
ncbi:MAG: DUF262 domain-containing protein [Candidatus Gracilibacteria bacterium]|nr:DUF262 domain-containing protein [Candidatus Gracilibacteria bacterium]